MPSVQPNETGAARLFVAAVVLTALSPACAQVLGVESITITENAACEDASECPLGKDLPNGCAERACVDGRCAYLTRDEDGDGFRTSAACTVDLPGVTVTPGDDCDDADPLLSPVKRRACTGAPGTPSPFPTSIPLGECRAGEQACEGGAIGPCVGVVGPQPETCDGAKDENCDGAIDEGCPCSGTASRECGVAVGACGPGTQTCSENEWSGCIGGTGPKPRDCTSPEDNDCDGEVDDAQCGCVVGSEETCATGTPGKCGAGKRTCVASEDKTTASLSACKQTIFPAALACDGGDNDCNGIIDTMQDAPAFAADAGNACLHLFFCPAADRREVCFRAGVGYTYFCEGTTRRTLGYAKKASSAGSPNPAPPAGYVRFAVNGAGTKVGPYKIASACCGPGGCNNPNDANDGVFLSTGESGTQLYTRWP